MSPLHPTNVVNSWLRKCPLSLFESRNPRTFSPFNNDLLINDIHIPLYSAQNINGYTFFRRINSIPTSGHSKLISDQKICGKMTPTTERGQSQAARGQWSHVSGGGTHVPTCKQPSRVCQDAHDSHLSGPAKPHQEAEVCARGALRRTKLHRSNAGETHL